MPLGMQLVPSAVLRPADLTPAEDADADEAAAALSEALRVTCLLWVESATSLTLLAPSAVSFALGAVCFFGVTVFKAIAASLSPSPAVAQPYAAIPERTIRSAI